MPGNEIRTTVSVMSFTGAFTRLLSKPNSVQVLHIDRNNYYGGQSASLNLNQVYDMANRSVACTEDTLERS